MGEVVASIDTVSTLVNQISHATREQDQGVASSARSVTEMDRATQQNAALVEETAAAAASLRQQAQQLVEAVAVFKLQARH
jgi:methyl-accepting chemotaxis protein